jgi:hypothetical protein
MKTSRVEARLEESIVGLFQDLPALCGFTVQTQGGVGLTDVGLYPPPPPEDAKLICEEIHDTLAALVEERPEARALIAGRTFARALH